jgi:hypothetical protein
MLKEPAFANSLTILTGVSYIVLCLLAIVSRDTFRFSSTRSTSGPVLHLSCRSNSR